MDLYLIRHTRPQVLDGVCYGHADIDVAPSFNEDFEILKTKLSPQDYKLLFDHSTLAAKKIELLPEIPPDVAMIVRQHHELPNEKGYPSKLSFNKITPLSSVFIVAHDLTHYILDNPQWTMKDYLLKVKTKFKGAHFARILSGLGDMR